jgi:hypothetical protein
MCQPPPNGLTRSKSNAFLNLPTILCQKGSTFALLFAQAIHV